MAGYAVQKGLRVDKKQSGVYYTVRKVDSNREAYQDANHLTSRSRLGAALRASRYRVAGAVMLAVGALLLTASGGYYAYAQFAKAGRDDFIHKVPRPSFPEKSTSAYADTEGRPSIRQSKALEVASTDSTSESRAVQQSLDTSSTSPQTKAFDAQVTVAGIHAKSASSLPGTVQALIEVSRVDQAPVTEDSANAPPGGEQINSVTETVDLRVAAALEALLNLQARNPGYVGLEPESQVAVDQTESEPSQGISQLVRVIQPNQDRNPTTREVMVANLLESDYSRTTPTVPEPKYATRMIVPEIGLRATVEELEVVEEDDSRAWETPKHVVGHIPTTAKPGTSGQGWYFGHLESPISGEGNIFRRLPELAARFKRGEQFTIHLDVGDERYVYQVYRTDVVHASEFAVSDSGLNDITLVSCWPQYEYSERVLVTAALVEIVEIPEAERIPSSSS